MNWQFFNDIYQVVNGFYKILLPLFIIVILCFLIKIMVESNKRIIKKNELLDKELHKSYISFSSLPISVFYLANEEVTEMSAELHIKIIGNREFLYTVNAGKSYHRSIFKNKSYGKDEDWTSDYEYFYRWCGKQFYFNIISIAV